MAIQREMNGSIARSGMTDLMPEREVISGQERETVRTRTSDISIEEFEEGSPLIPSTVEGTVLQGTMPGGGGNFGQSGTYPMIIPNSPTFTVPANPLLPEGYNEILDYNSIQYLNGIFRTQIGRYVRVEMLIGSSNIEEYEGFLIGVGINYVILQDYSTKNIRIIDIYGIKTMFVYYSDLTNPYIGA